MNPKPSSIEEYFSWFSPEIQSKLQEIRSILKKTLPDAKEVISYHMPAFKTSEVLVYYAAMKNHLGFYPTNSGVSEFKEELKGFVTSKGAIQIPYDIPLPEKLIRDIAIFRQAEAEDRKAKKSKK
ncbi:iron chaperone [Algoriphagus zhangzhouensis]|uniref:Uncharacterized conserved protein YdhG, YjbR/CyaY-like superfamily, DUF1801 family n=1 Tax=Algoriphagus zhangzhouensis TaxID=1073327 RepID=A0A1M7Z808_9BACT|nr:DUF1801 domain-containing protein [Algoriphagus zhangzhouensis]TDY49410.1 uncharacterized protein YdhG (YjbR/CyaY superfamily) [Algoriphagus zhangzhouensis]SHO60900.1 Uncharacterized conserved protein YdhG, YjbR/CyaY-like superfamily, DUF1801 family [Algoriphagus zhangzhouensis]